MTKGRDFVPSTANQGIWFRHRGEPGDPEGRLRDSTSTGDMMAAPFSAPSKPRPPPVPFQRRDEEIYKGNYPFTQHDNRHYFQSHGVYLGDGKDTRNLGRHLHPIDQRLHHTNDSFLHHQCRNPTFHEYNPITASSFRHPGDAPVISTRRFPKIYRNAESAASPRCTEWAATNHRTPLHVLALTQEPFLAHNKWKYSFHGHPRVYPPYNRKPFPAVPNVLNRYGADFATVPVPTPKSTPE